MRNGRTDDVQNGRDGTSDEIRKDECAEAARRVNMRIRVLYCTNMNKEGKREEDATMRTEQA